MVKKFEQEKKFYQKKSKKNKYSRPEKAFDPNSYDVDEWMKLGLSAKQSNALINYIKKGITSDDQLRKSFVMSDELFALIQDSTFYAVAVEEENITKPISISLVNINTASKEELMSVHGIGNFYADKILEYRERIGGFVQLEQLLELWKFDEEKLQRVENQFSIGSESVKTLNVNTATIEELKAHPYISYKVANSIVKMRLAHGDYKELEALMNSKLIDVELYMKLKPYLTL